MLTIPVSVPQESGEGWSKVCRSLQHRMKSWRTIFSGRMWKESCDVDLARPDPGNN